MLAFEFVKSYPLGGAKRKGIVSTIDDNMRFCYYSYVILDDRCVKELWYYPKTNDLGSESYGNSI